MARPRARKSNTKRRNYRKAGLLRSRLGRVSRGLAVFAAVIAAILSVRQGEIFYPVDEPYNRTLYKHWVDADGDCRDTRTEVLELESLNPVSWLKDGCKVISGRWYDPFTDQTFTDPKQLDIDHPVPLAEVHRSGGHRWNRNRREAYANDLSHPDTLIAVSASANRSKADRDPLLWLPSNWSYICDYTDRWVATKARWNLQRDLLEEVWTDTIILICRS